MPTGKGLLLHRGRLRDLCRGRRGVSRRVAGASGATAVQNSVGVAVMDAAAAKPAYDPCDRNDRVLGSQGTCWSETFLEPLILRGRRPTRTKLPVGVTGNQPLALAVRCLV